MLRNAVESLKALKSRVETMRVSGVVVLCLPEDVLLWRVGKHTLGLGLFCVMEGLVRGTAVWT